MASPVCATPTWSEADRLAALERYGILDTGRETAFDDMAALVADLLDAPMAVVNLIAADRQWFKAEVGIGTDSLPLDVSICRHALLQPGVMVVPDLRDDHRFVGNPLIHVDGGLRFYAGALLEAPDGLPLGTICVLDREPRPQGLSEVQSRALSVLASQVMAQIELRRAKEEAQTTAGRQAFLLTLEERLHDLADPDAILSAALALLGQHLGLDRVGYTELIDRATVRMTGCHVANAMAPLTGEFPIESFGEARIARQRQGLTEVCDDVQAAPEQDADAWTALDTRAVVSVPLVREGQFRASLYVNSRNPRRWMLEEVALIEQVAARTWEAVERARAETALRASEEHLRAIVETATDYAIFTTDPEGLITTWPAGAQAVFGWSAAEAIGQPVDMTFVPEDRASGAPATERLTARTTGQAPNVRWRLRRDGSSVFIDGVTRPLRGEDGDITGFVNVGQDVTERRRVEARREALVGLAKRLRDLEDPEEIAFAASEILGQMLGVSRVGYATVDHEAETLHIERDWTAPGAASLAGALNLRDFGSYIDDMKRGEQIVISDVRLDDRTAATADPLEARSARSFVNVPVLERGRLVAMFFLNHAQVRDWSPEDLALIQEVAGWTRTAVERARNAVALRELNETLEIRVEERTAERDRMWDTSPDLMLVIDFEGVLRRVNPSWTKILGYEPGELAGHHVNEFVVSDDHQETVAAYEMAAEGGQPRIVNRYRHKDGSLRWISWTAAPAGNMTYATGRDITAERERQAELEAAQEALRQSQKMEAMGQLTGGVAHDFNNLLTPIIGSLDRLLTRGVGSPRERQLMDGALQSAERAKTLVQRLLAFARRQPLQPKAVDVRGLVGNMAELISSTTGPRIDVRVELAEALPPALADANQLEMALLNLAVNARDAMPEGGELSISATRESVRTGRRLRLRPGHYVRLSVRDTGMGMDQATLSRAVEPFYSTKGIGKGTGLGLSMVHGLALQLNGDLTITSQPGQGTTVDLWLPISAVAAEEDGQGHVATVAPKAHGTALLVDDEDLVRMSTADMLIDLGYEVVEATSAEQALRQIQAGLRPDLVVTDHLMPGLSGLDLARDLRSRRPDLPVLIVSGYAEMDGIAPGFLRLTKPFRAAELAASLSALMLGDQQ